MFTSPRIEKNQSDADADGAVGDVEGGQADFATALIKEKINEVHDVADAQAVKEIAEDGFQRCHADNGRWFLASWRLKDNLISAAATRFSTPNPSSSSSSSSPSNPLILRL